MCSVLPIAIRFLPILTILLLVATLFSADSSADVDATDNKPASTSEKEQVKELIQAAVRRDRDRIKDLLAAGVDINAKGTRGLTAYLAAKVAGNEEIAKMLTVLGADKDPPFDPAKFVTLSLHAETEIGKPGIAVLIARGEEVLFSGAAGTANIAHQVPVTLETKFRIGSVSKQFTAAAILKLQETGKLSVQDKLAEFVADFPRGDEVTLHHLLTHTSGLKNYTSEPDFYDTVASQVETEDMIAKFKELGFASEPGRKFEYCNTGYFLLAFVVEQVSGMSFGKYLHDEFFDPIGMHHTGVHTSTGIFPHEATGYSFNDDTTNKAIDWDMSRAKGAGELYSTVTDLHKWNQAVFHGNVLNEESLTAAHTVYGNEAANDKTNKTADSINMPYGYGWMMDEHRGLKRISHSGGLHGFVTQLTYYPEIEVTIVAMHNAFPSISALSPGLVCDRMAEVFLWPDMKPRPKHVIDDSVSPDTYDDYAGQYDYRSAVMTVTKEDNRLMAQLTGQPKYEIYPSAPDRFFWKVVEAQAEFERDENGKVTGVRHSQGIAKFLAPRIEPREQAELTDGEMDQFVGKYKYNAFQTLTVRRDGKQLFAKMTGQSEMQVFPESETKLFWKVINAQLEIKMDDEGNIVGATHYQAGQEIPVTKQD